MPGLPNFKKGNDLETAYVSCSLLFHSLSQILKSPSHLSLTLIVSEALENVQWAATQWAVFFWNDDIDTFDVMWSWNAYVLKACKGNIRGLCCRACQGGAALSLVLVGNGSWTEFHFVSVIEIVRVIWFIIYDTQPAVFMVASNFVLSLNLIVALLVFSWQSHWWPIQFSVFCNFDER